MEKVSEKDIQEALKSQQAMKIEKEVKDFTGISMKEFLGYLQTAYQVTDSVEEILQAEGMVEAVDWIKLKNTELVKPKTVSCQTSMSHVAAQSMCQGKSQLSNIKIHFVSIQEFKVVNVFS